MNAELAQPRPQDTLADLAKDRAGASRVFLRHGLDFCCHGMVSLEQACKEHELGVDDLIAQIVAEEKQHDAPEKWEERNAADLIEYILTAFHEKHREEVPRLIAMAAKVERVHAEKSACPKGLSAFLEQMAGELEDHMQKEEQILFPAILQGAGPMVAMPIQVMESEHKDHGRNLEELRRVAFNFDPPEEACGTWRALYLGLAELEGELMRHIHLENYVLFPKALGN